MEPLATFSTVAIINLKLWLYFSRQEASVRDMSLKPSVDIYGALTMGHVLELQTNEHSACSLVLYVLGNACIKKRQNKTLYYFQGIRNN